MYRSLLRSVLDRLQEAVLVLAALTGIAVVGLARVGARSPGRIPATPLLPSTSSAEAHPADSLSAAADRLHPEVTSVTDAAPLGAGWILLDGSARRLHRLGPEATLVASFGGPGDGPGEYRAPAAVAVVGDTVVVVEASGVRMHLVTPDGEFLGRRDPAVPGCSVPMTLDAEGSRSGPIVLLRCPEPDGSLREVAALIDLAGSTRILRTWSSPGDGISRTLFREPLLGAGGAFVALGRQNRRCFVLLRLAVPPSDPKERRCLPPGGRIPLGRDERSGLRAHFDGLEARTGVRVRVPRHHPYLYRLHVAGGEPLALVPAGQDRLELRVVGVGEPTPVPVAADGSIYVSAEAILQTREEVHGVRVRIFPFDPS